jgi:hypothetical protein
LLICASPPPPPWKGVHAGKYELFSRDASGAAGDTAVASGHLAFAAHWRPADVTLDVSGVVDSAGGAYKGLLVLTNE